MNRIKLGVFEGFSVLSSKFQTHFDLIIISDDPEIKLDLEINNFIIPIDLNLVPMINMKLFSPTAFGSLHLAFNIEKSQPISSNFVGTLRSSPSSNETDSDRNEQMKRPWCENLLPFIEDPNHPDVIESNSEMVFVIDRFPKGSSHFLCLPKKRIDTWWYLKSDDIPLLKRMLNEAEVFSKRISSASGLKSKFKFGFHVIPSMKQLHLHIVNMDFNSPKLTDFQWNAFNIDFLVSIPQVIKELEEKNGKILMDQDRWDNYWALLYSPLKCSICDKKFNQLSKLKIHYLREYNGTILNKEKYTD